jgi:hypothetical protein
VNQPNSDTLVVIINGCPFVTKLDFHIDGIALAYENVYSDTGEPLCESNITILNVNKDEIDKYKVIVDDLCDILALFTNQRWWAFGYLYGSQGHRTSVGDGDGRHPVLINTDNETMLNAISLVWSNYQKYKNDRSLPAIIDYFIKINDNNPPLEVGLLTVSAMLECLKWSWLETKCDKGMLIKKGDYYFSKDAQTGGKVGKKYSFDSSLMEMFGEFGMTCNLSFIKELRNNIVHTGLSGYQIQCRHPVISFTLHTVRDSALDLMREYVLRLLGYKGQYWKYSVRAGCNEAIAEIT